MSIVQLNENITWVDIVMKGLKCENTVRCEYCNKIDGVDQYDSIFSDNQILLCQKCYERECCPGCGIEAGGMCKSCKSEFYTFA